MAFLTSTSSPALAGYHGKYLWVDLSTGASQVYPLSSEILRQFVGGSGLGTYLLLKHEAAAVASLAEKSCLAFVFSPLVGSPLTTSAKFTVVGKSPLTDRLNDSLASSRFAIDGKKTGFDAIVVSGKADQLSILIIDEQGVRLQPCPALRHEPCSKTEAWLKQNLGASYSFAVIGPAGENLVRYATISHDGRHAGRGGSGAVLGSKQIKAIAVRGTHRTEWGQPEKLVALAKSLSEKSMGPATAKYRELGTVSNLLTFNRLKTLPTLNFREGSFAGAQQLSPEVMAKEFPKTRSSCVACTIGCEHLFSVKDQDSGAAQPVRLEYENLFALGPLVGNADPQKLLRASKLCDEMGLDTISLGGTLAFAMECAERGLAQFPTLQQAGKIDLESIIQQVAHRSEVGNWLAEGSRHLAQQIGQGSLAFAAQVKGLELPGYEPRALQTMALGFAVGARGADHNRSGAYEHDFTEGVDRRQMSDNAGDLVIASEDKAALMDSLILCKFVRGVFEDFFAETAEFLGAITGQQFSSAELRQTAKRIVTAKKLFNLRAGWQPEEDTLPARFLEEPLRDDAAAKLSKETLQRGIQGYYAGRGWTENGKPTGVTLAELDLSQL